MPTPAIMNKISKRILPYWTSFTIIAILSFLIFAFLIFQLRGQTSNVEVDSSLIKPIYVSSIVCLWSFGFLLIISWFKNITGPSHARDSSFQNFKYKIKKFFEWYAAIFCVIYFLAISLLSLVFSTLIFFS